MLKNSLGGLVLGFMMLSGAEVVVRPLTVDDWEEFRDLRLKALAEEPKAYGISAEDEAGKSEDEWKGMCDEGKWFFVAQHEGKLVGMLGAVELYGSFMRHQVEICSAYVEPSYRRQGVLSRLYEGLRVELQEVPHLEQMIVWVTLHETQVNKPAFEKFGFKLAGTLSKTVKFEDEYYDCCWLEAPLKSHF
ncbi:MAG: GNAT family N-acetyltransferase [Parachlamydiaceae bacterium]